MEGQRNSPSKCGAPRESMLPWMRRHGPEVPAVVQALAFAVIVVRNGRVGTPLGFVNLTWPMYPPNVGAGAAVGVWSLMGSGRKPVRNPLP